MKIASLGDFWVYLHKSFMQELLSVSACGEGDCVMGAVVADVEYSPKSGCMTYFRVKP